MNSLKRFFTSIDFIEDSLFKSISVDTIAQSAYFSTYHYCRIFKAIVGESVMSYVRKRRLTEAADLLAKTDMPILAIAIQCQFESQEAFTRAFKNQFKETPGKYRKLNERFYLLHKKKFDSNALDYRQHNIALEPNIVTKSKTLIIGIPTTYQYDDFDLMKLWSVFHQRKTEIINRVPDTKGFGVYENYQEQVGGKEQTTFTYICSAEVNTLEYIPNGMVGRVIPGHMYAVFTHRGIMEKIDDTLKYIWGDWLPTSGYTYANKPDFELYTNRFVPCSEESELDLYIPIRA